MMKRKLILICLVLFISLYPVLAQISEGGLPPSFNYPSSSLRSASLQHRVEANLDIDRLLWEDEVSAQKDAPVRVAVVVPAHINMDSTGQWRTLPDSTYIWQQTVSVEGAAGLIISYEDFYIPKGGKLFIYNSDKSHILGAYTHESHPSGGKFATEPIAGDSFTLEYVASKDSDESPRIIIESLGYMYNKSINANGTPLPGINTPNIESGHTTCRINVNCLEGQNWQNQKRGIILFFVKLYDTEWTACSGSLINNAGQPGKPYVLTASHCFGNAPDYEQTIVFFNHEFPGCANQTVVPDYKSLVGVNPLVYIPMTRGSDTFMYEIKNNVPNEWKPYYNGWSRKSEAARSGAVIHHPNTDVKKIVIYESPLTTATYGGASGAHWRVVYNEQSVTERGSSGSPIFNEDGLIVGTLTGGDSYCEARKNPDYYGKLWYAWDKYPYDIAFEQKLKVYLDPLNTGVESLEGYDPNGISGIDETNIEKRELILFPNPAGDELNVNAGDIIRSVKVYTIQGRLVFSQTGYTGSTITINLTGWNPGAYTVVVETDAKKISEKFLKK